MMNKIIDIRPLVALAIILMVSISSVQVALAQGNDGTNVPAIGSGLSIHNLFQSNMVIQRDKPIVVWGWAKPDDVVTVSFAGKQGTATAGKDGAWSVALPAMPANSAPQQMITKGKTETVTLDNILLGDVWVLGGQSNMQHPLSRVEEGTVEIASANLPGVRLLTIPQIIDNKEKKNFPRRQAQKQADGDWDVCSPTTVGEFSGIGYTFGRRIHLASQIPIGIIDASQFGTTVEAWTPLSILRSMDSDAVRAQLADWDKKAAVPWDARKDLENRIKQFDKMMAELAKQGKPSNAKPPSDLRPGAIDNQNYPGNCYNSMIAPIAGFAVKGAIWHQGFNNSRYDAPEFYYQVFPRMIESWRAAFNDAKMPFGIISLCTDGIPQTLDHYDECMLNMGVYVREAQYKVFLDYFEAGDKNIGFASSFDLRRAWYHPQEKIPAGERIARWAMATQYGLEKFAYWKPPMITKMETKDGTILLHFDSEVGSVDSQAIAGFAISGSDKKYQPAQAEALVTGKDGKGRPVLNKKVLVLSSPYVTEPVHFRYAWGRNPMGNLRISNTNEKDISFPAQRSDGWEFWEVPYLEPPADKGESRISQDKIREVLKFIDLERRVMDAERTLKAEKPHYEELKKTFK
jgi:sialate O-acetylesterase